MKMICLLGCFASKEKREYCIHETLQDNYQQKINCLESFVMFIVFFNEKKAWRGQAFENNLFTL